MANRCAPALGVTNQPLRISARDPREIRVLQGCELRSLVRRRLDDSRAFRSLSGRTAWSCPCSKRRMSADPAQSRPKVSSPGSDAGRLEAGDRVLAPVVGKCGSRWCTPFPRPAACQWLPGMVTRRQCHGHGWRNICPVSGYTVRKFSHSHPAHSLGVRYATDADTRRPVLVSASVLRPVR